MEYGFDPELKRQLAALNQQTRRQRNEPRGEWPVVFDEQHNALLVVREWPDGELTAFLMPRR